MSGAETSYLETYGPRLLDRGYPIVPIRAGTKNPGFKGWQNTVADRSTLKRWLENGFARGGVGVLAKAFPAVDLDIQDAATVQKLVDWCDTHVGPTVRRIGQAPRQLLVFRTETPFSKITSNTYTDFLGRPNEIEILGDGQQFVAYAVHPVTGKPYEWVSADELADVAADALPTITADQANALIAYFESIVPGDWTLTGAASAARRANTAIPETERVLAHAKPKVNKTTAQLKAALARLDPDMDRDPWVRVGMALYHQYDGDDEGFTLWDDWSAPGVEYDAGQMRTLWRSFEADLRTTDPVTAATILQMANPARGKTDTDGPLLDRFRERYVFVEHGNLVCDLTKPPHCAVSRLEEFRNSTANVRHLVPAPTKAEPDREKLQPVHFAWLVAEDRKTAQGVRYDPSEPFFFSDGGLWWVNECHMPAFKESAGGDAAVFHDHMTYLFPIKRERAWFVDWMAFNLQFPQRRCKVTPLHISLPHGTGRGWVVEVMGRLLGPWNCTKTKMSALAGDGSSGAFQDYLNKSLFCAVEEVREGKRRYGVSDRTRDLLTENRLEVNVKYGGKYTQPVFTNFFLMSNHPDALVITAEDRRINVFSGPNSVRDRDYYQRLYAWLETDGVAALHAELMACDLSDFNWQHAMDTPSRTRMIEGNRTETETLFLDLLADPPFPAMTIAQIVQEMTKLSERDAFTTNIDESQLVKLLQHHACQARKITIGGRKGKTVRPWLLDPDAASDMEKIRQAVEACGPA